MVLANDAVLSFSQSGWRADRLTATQMIDGVECCVVLERDPSGHYREVDFKAVRTMDGADVPP